MTPTASMLSLIVLGLLLMSAYALTEGKPIGDKIDNILKKYLFK